MIAIVDYGVGNLTSVKKAFDCLGASSRIASEPAHFAGAAKIVLPGVGHFASTAEIGRRGLDQPIRDAIARGVPMLGICVGMQWMFEGSEEAPEVPGLGLFAGRCERFKAAVKTPHVGWNTLTIKPESQLLRGINDGAFVYYTHSYRAPVVPGAVAETEYGEAFSAVVETGRVFGTQFHPEKSGEAGLRLLGNFCELPC